MKIFGLNINFSRATNVTKNVPNEALLKNSIQKIQPQIFRISQDIGRYRDAVTLAESYMYPNRYQLIQTNNDVVLDAHYTAAWQQRKNLSLCKDYEVVNSKGESNEKLTELIDTKWFRDFIDLSLDSKPWGYSLIQFNDLINDSFSSVQLVPRQYVKPEFNLVTNDPMTNTGINYTEMPWSQWCIGVGGQRDLGLLLKVAPLVIWKKNAMGAWANFQEMFGVPIRIGKTNTRDSKTHSSMVDMLKNMASSAWGVFDMEDTLEMIESKHSDSFMVFDSMIERCNSEISKIIIGQTGTVSEKSFVGSAEVHERVLEGYAENDEYFLDGVLNYQLIPLLEGLGISFKGYKIKVCENDELSAIDQSKIDLELLKYYDIPEDYIEKKYGTPVIKRAIDTNPDNSIKNVMNELKDLYN